MDNSSDSSDKDPELYDSMRFESILEKKTPNQNILNIEKGNQILELLQDTKNENWNFVMEFIEDNDFPILPDSSSASIIQLSSLALQNSNYTQMNSILKLLKYSLECHAYPIIPFSLSNLFSIFQKIISSTREAPILNLLFICLSSVSERSSQKDIEQYPQSLEIQNQIFSLIKQLCSLINPKFQDILCTLVETIGNLSHLISLSANDADSIRKAFFQVFSFCDPISAGIVIKFIRQLLEDCSGLSFQLISSGAAIFLVQFFTIQYPHAVQDLCKIFIFLLESPTLGPEFVLELTKTDLIPNSFKILESASKENTISIYSLYYYILNLDPNIASAIIPVINTRNSYSRGYTSDKHLLLLVGKIMEINCIIDFEGKQRIIELIRKFLSSDDLQMLKESLKILIIISRNGYDPNQIKECVEEGKELLEENDDEELKGLFKIVYDMFE